MTTGRVLTEEDEDEEEEEDELKGGRVLLPRAEELMLAVLGDGDEEQ